MIAITEPMLTNKPVVDPTEVGWDLSLSFGAEELFLCHTVGFGSGTGRTGCPTGLVPWLPCDGRNQRCPLVALNRLIEREVPPAEAFGPDRHLVAYGGRDLVEHLPQYLEHQQLDRGRHLVAYPQTSFCAFASIRGGSDATVALARLDRGRRSDRRSPVWPANVVDWRACWPADTAPSDRTFGDGDYEHRQGRSLGSTGISSGRKKIHDPLPPCQINSPPSACNDTEKNIHPEEGIRDFCEVIQEDGGGRTPHFQTGAFTAFSDRRAH